MERRVPGLVTIVGPEVAVVTGAGRRGGIGETVGLELARCGAHVIVGDICAPPTELLHAGSGEREELVAVVAKVPLGRFATPEDVAHLVAYLASDRASFITGQANNLTGGRELT